MASTVVARTRQQPAAGCQPEVAAPSNANQSYTWLLIGLRGRQPGRGFSGLPDQPLPLAFRRLEKLAFPRPVPIVSTPQRFAFPR